MLEGVVINDIDEIYALTNIAKQHYILAATNSGISYTETSVYGGTGTLNGKANKISFASLTSFPQVKVTDLEIDSRPLINADNNKPDYEYLCDQVIWAATENGIYQLSAALDQNGFDDVAVGMSFNSIPSNNDHKNPVFERCDDQEPIMAFLSAGSLGAKIKWFKDSQNIPAWDDSSSVSLSENGTYHAEILASCEGITLKSIKVVLKNDSPGDVSFVFPDNITACENSTVLLSTVKKTQYTYRWKRDNVLLDGQSLNTYSVTQSGSYSVEVSSCGGPYYSSKSVNVAYEKFPEIEIVSQKKSYCAGDEATLITSIPSGYTVKWALNGQDISQNANGLTLLTKVPGKYTATMTHPAGCSKSSAVFDLVFEAPAFAIKRSKLKTICFGEVVTLSTDIPGASYAWSTGETSPSIIVSRAGTYSVEMTNPAGCKNTRAIDIEIAPLLEIPDIPQALVCTIAEEKVRIFAEPGFASYSWNGTVTSDDYFDVTKPGTYELIVTDVNGCTANTTFLVEPFCKEIVVKNTFTPNGDGFNDIWEIGGIDKDQNAKLMIYNRFGNIVFQTSGPSFKWDGKMNNTELPLGTYYYFLYARQGTGVFKGAVTILR